MKRIKVEKTKIQVHSKGNKELMNKILTQIKFKAQITKNCKIVQFF